MFRNEHAFYKSNLGSVERLHSFQKAIKVSLYIHAVYMSFQPLTLTPQCMCPVLGLRISNPVLSYPRIVISTHKVAMKCHFKSDN